MAENIYFTTLAKSLAMLLFEHITKENREVGITFCKTKLMSDVGTLVIMTWQACVGLDILTL